MQLVQYFAGTKQAYDHIDNAVLLNCGVLWMSILVGTAHTTPTKAGCVL